MPLLDSPEANEWRSILTAQAETAQRLKLARAEAVRRYIDLKAAEMWALVEQDTETEARAAWMADVEAKVLWGVYSAGRTSTDADDA